jgi:peptidoglycan hydrolase-like protein with peptidoglycan-binding domain
MPNNIVKKIIASVVTITCAVWMMGPGMAQALTAEELQDQINDLLAQLSALQSQLSTLEGGAGVAITGCTITSFDQNLKQGMSGDDVNCLQIVLNSDADTQLAASGVGSPGNETSYFGPLTNAAVIKFQEKYADEVLASWG